MMVQQMRQVKIADDLSLQFKQINEFTNLMEVLPKARITGMKEVVSDYILFFRW